MKILFFIALLINIVFFLWEINSADLNIPLADTSNNKVAKQILLVSELSKNNEKSDITITEINNDKFIQIDVSESITNDSGNQKGEGLSLSEDIFGNDVIQDPLNEKEEIEADVTQQMTHDVAGINPIESDGIKPELNQKVLVDTDKGDQEDGFPESNSFWPDFSFIFDKENKYSSEINNDLDSKEFSKTLHAKDVGSSSFSAAFNQWSNSFLGRSNNKDDGVSISQQNDNILAKTQEQAKKSYCYEVGPFVSSLAIEKWRKSNKINKDSLQEFNVNNKVATRYLVYHPAEDTFEQSKVKVKRYKKKRLSEVWLFRKGDLRGAISFGLFRKEKRAIKLQKKLIKNGLNVEIIERYKTQADKYAQILTKEKTSKSMLILSEQQTINKCG